MEMKAHMKIENSIVMQILIVTTSHCRCPMCVKFVAFLFHLYLDSDLTLKWSKRNLYLSGVRFRFHLIGTWTWISSIRSDLYLTWNWNGSTVRLEYDLNLNFNLWMWPGPDLNFKVQVKSGSGNFNLGKKLLEGVDWLQDILDRSAIYWKWLSTISHLTKSLSP